MFGQLTRGQHHTCPKRALGLPSCRLTKVVSLDSPQLAGNGHPSSLVRHQASMGQGVTSDWRHAAVSQPILNGTPLVGVTICSNGWLHHPGLHTNHHSMDTRKTNQDFEPLLNQIIDFLWTKHQINEYLLCKHHTFEHLPKKPSVVKQ